MTLNTISAIEKLKEQGNNGQNVKLKRINIISSFLSFPHVLSVT